MKFLIAVSLLGLLYKVTAFSDTLIPSKLLLKAVHFTIRSTSDGRDLGCVMTCWEDSKYVSACRSDMLCLCDDTEYQTVSPALTDD